MIDLINISRTNAIINSGIIINYAYMKYLKAKLNVLSFFKSNNYKSNKKFQNNLNNFYPIFQIQLKRKVNFFIIFINDFSRCEVYFLQ